MAIRRGICKNIGNCSLADKKQTISLREAGNCPSCGEKLHEVASLSLVSKKNVVLFLMVSGLAAGFAWHYSGIEPQPNQIFSQLISLISGDDEPQFAQEILVEIEHLKNQMADLSSLEEHLARIQEALEKLKLEPNSKEKLKEKLIEIQNELNHLKQNPQLANNLAKIQAELAKLKHAQSGNDLTEIQEELNQLKLNSDHFETKLGDIQKNINKLQPSPNLDKELAEIRVELSEIQGKVNKFGQTTPTLQGKFQQMSKKLNTLAEANIPKCLLSASVEIKEMLPVSRVPRMSGKKISSDLYKWIKDKTHATIYESPFFIMRREVKVEEFRHYVDTLTDDQKEQLGTEWYQDGKGNLFPDANPVVAVPWWAANGYAEWLSETTDCTLSLPTYNQWIAAVMHYAEPRTAIIRTQKQQKIFEPHPRDKMPTKVLDLLGNLREWSKDNQGQKTCGKGSYYLLGEDYKTWRENIIGEPLCESSTLDTIGFRLVMQE